MTQPQTLSVEYSELMARADELEQPLPDIPATNPAPPCALTYTVDAAQQLALSANSVRLYLTGCQREWRSLAKSLREAAKAYQEVDEEAADALNNDGSVTSASVGGDDEGSGFEAPPPIKSHGMSSEYYEVFDAIYDIENGDHGTAFRAFADDWDAYRMALQQAAYRFRPFTAWEGDARAAVEAAFEQQRQWLLGMVPMCSMLSSQADQVVAALKALRPESGSASHSAEGVYDFPEQHPGPIDMYNVNWWIEYYKQNKPEDLHYAMEWYAKLQEVSEGALEIFVVSASLPLAPVNPNMFPTANTTQFKFDPGTGDGTPDPGDLIPDLGDLIPDFGNGGNGNGGNSDAGNSGDDGLAAADDLGASGLSEVPSLGGMPTQPNVPTPETPKAPPVPSGYAALSKGGVKPMSVAGGGAAGVPGMPKPSWGDAGTSAVGSAGAGAGAGAGKGLQIPSRYAALNGAGGGGMPIGGGAPGGQGQKDAKTGKRLAAGDDALYTEDRAWTEGVIGRRRAQDAEQPKLVKAKTA